MAQLKIDLIVDDKGSIVVSKFSGNAAKEFATAGGHVDNFGKRLAVGGAALATFGAAFGSMLAIVGGKGLSVFADIETRMIGVQKTTDFTAKEMQTFGAAITDMGRRVPVATAALLDIAGVAGQLGIKGVGNVAKFTEVVGKLSLATDIVGAEGAASIARLLNVTGEGIGTVDKFGAVLVALGNNSAATESEILGLATEIGLATSVFSVTSADALAMGAAMKSIGIQAELGGSVVGRAMRTIEASIAAGGAEMANLSNVTGIAEKDLKKAFGDDATAVFQKWLHGIGGLIEGGMTAAEALELFGLKGEEVLKVLPTMAVNTGVLDKAMKLANDEMERGTALDIEAAKAGEAFAAQINIGRNILTEMGVAIGEELAPEMKGLINNFKEWWIENDKIITQDIAGNIGDLATVVFQNKDAIISLFSGLAQGAAATVEGVSNVVRSIKGLAIVAASKDKTIFDWMEADPAKMKAWQGEIDSGVAFAKDRIAELIEKRNELSSGLYFSKESEENMRQQVTAINDQIAALNRQVDATKKTGEATTASGEAAVVAGAAAVEAEKTVQTGVAATVSVVKAATEEQKRQAEQLKKSSEEMTNYIKQQTLSEYEYKKWALAQDIAGRKNAAAGQKAALDQITEYEKEKLKEIEEKRSDSIAKDLEMWQKSTAGKIELMNAQGAAQKTTVDTFVKLEQLKVQGNRDTLGDIEKTNRRIIEEAWKTEQELLLASGGFSDGVGAALLEIKNDFITMGDVAYSTIIDIRDTFGAEVGDYLVEEFGGIEGEWGGLWDRALQRFGDYLGDMVTRWAAAVAEMVAIWAASKLFGTGGAFQVGDGSFFSGLGASGGSGGIGGAATGIMGEAGKEYLSQTVKTELAAYFSSNAGAAFAASSSTNLAQGTATPAIMNAAADSASGYGSYLSTAGGVIGVGAGMYGMYSGINNMAEGNYAVGGVQTGLGAYSTYQGAVTLGLIQEGTATAAYDAVAAAIQSYYSGTAAATTATTATTTGTTAAATTGTTAGTTAGSTAGGISGGMVGGVLMAALSMYGMKQLANQRPTRNSFGHEDPEGLDALGFTSSITNSSAEQASLAMERFNMDIKQFGAVSLDAANGVMVATNALAGPNGFVEGTKFGLYTWDEGSKTWYKGTVENQHVWTDMLNQMVELKPASEEAAQANADYVASLFGLPTVADELTTAFMATAEGAALATTAQTQYNDLQLQSSEIHSIAAVDLAKLNELQQQGLVTINESSGTWETQTGLFSSMVGKMQEMRPTTSAAIQATAQYIATAHGVPEMADQLMLAFTQLGGGIYNLAGASVTASGSISAALARLSTAPVSSSEVLSGEPIGRDEFAGAATGGYLAAHPGGGVIRAGSHNKDDVYLKSGGGMDFWGMGGEFVVNPASTAKYIDELNAINNDSLNPARMFGSRQFNIATGDSGDSDSFLAAEIRMMRNELSTKLHAIAVSCEKTQSILRRWEGQGMPLRG